MLPSLLLASPGLVRAQTQYTTDGTTTALEEEIRWLHNRARFNPAAENVLRGTAYTDVPATAGPLAPHQSITAAARNHASDMARLNVFQHNTIPGSAYYNPAIRPGFSDRLTAEGYSWNTAGENIAAGYTTAEAVHVGWWGSTGHRGNFTRVDFREIGCGYAYNGSSTGKHYYVVDLGASGTNHFFTGTLFHDSNSNGKYDQSEGRGSVEVTLRVNGVAHSRFDVSAAAGSFAIPIQTITTGANVVVSVRNLSAGAVQLSIPRNFQTLATFSLPAGGTRAIGTFTKASNTANVGFRNLTPVVVAPPVSLALIDNSVRLTWTSESGLSYLPQYSTDLSEWHDGATNSLPGTGGEMTWTQSASPPGVPSRFYRLIVTITP